MSGANQSHIAVSDFTLLMQEGRDASSSTACMRHHRYFSHRSSARCSQRAGQKQWPVGKLACSYTTVVSFLQMIDTSVVRVHQHGACVSDNNHQDMGRSRGGLTSKIHAVVGHQWPAGPS